MRITETTRLRAVWIPHACGEVLEVVIGSGLNLPFYSRNVQRIYGVHPSVELQRIARKRTVAKPIKIEFLSQSAEEPLPLPNTSIHTVVVTGHYVPHVKRVLKMSGRLIFVEHGRAP